MNTAIDFMVGAIAKAPVSSIMRVEPTLFTDCAKCEGNLNFGIFFDGTNNNAEADQPKFKDSNVTRLFRSYPEKPMQGYYRRYIPGVGTRFPEIREKGESALGSGFAIGCEERVLFALLWVFNAIHRAAFDGAAFFDAAQVAALCCCQSKNGPLASFEDVNALNSLGLQSGLRIPDTIGNGMREEILKDQAKKLEKKLARGRPIIKELFIDIFGFSRGAAEARVFCHWLDDLLVGGKLAGVIVHFRFVGLMDTVASAGFWSSVMATTTGLNGGHSGWADARFLRIPPSVKNCVHMVAMHELRKNFPLDTVTVDGELLPNCQEFAYPGTHSDVGGGYMPGELGISKGKNEHEGDALKLAQIPLNHMFECAVAAGAPMKKNLSAIPLNSAPFAIDPRVQKAFDNFLAISKLTPRPVHEWLQPYLTWRWQERNNFVNLEHVKKANETDKALLIKYNNYLRADAKLLETLLKRGLLNYLPLPQNIATIPAMLPLATLDNEAANVLASAKAAAPTPPALHILFDNFVHDSLAGFDLHSLELTGYWRYRKGFLGNSQRTIAENDDPESGSNVAATG